MSAPPRPPAEMVPEPWDSPLAARLPVPVLQAAQYLGQHFLLVGRDSLYSAIAHLKDAETFDFLIDLTAVDHPHRPARFELVYTLHSFHLNERLRVKTEIGDGESAASIVAIHHGADWLEREVYDMFGIRFDGHPNLKRILLPDEWTGHPLRKEYGITEMDNAWVQANLGIESGQ